MKKLTGSVTMLVALGLLALAATWLPAMAATRSDGAPIIADNDEMIFFENFESGAVDWQTVDLTAEETWHKDNTNAYGGAGQSWWSGDTVLGGYDNLTLQYLDSPVIDLSAAVNPVLDFDAFWSMEGLTGGYPAGYDGWDGADAWVSTDGGTSWHVLAVQTPAYTCNSLAGFGVTWSFGPGIGGWAGYSGGVAPGAWVHVSANMAGSLSSTVKIRFAMASDEQLCTRNESEWKGFFVDNIYLHEGFTVYLRNNAEGTIYPSDMVPLSGLGYAGQEWHIQVVGFPPPPSLVHAMVLSNESGSYSPGLNDALISPRISLADYSIDSVTITADFYVRGLLNEGDTEGWPKLDYWTVQVTPNEGRNWYSYATPWNEGTPGDFWIDANNNYSLFSQMTGAAIDLTPYSGEEVRLRVLFRSDDDAFTGEGLFLDNFWISATPLTGVEDTPAVIPVKFALEQNHPNPFNPVTVIPFSLPNANVVTLSVYDLQGRIVSELAQGWYPAGRHEVAFNAAHLPSGMYLYRLIAGSWQASGKMVLMK